MARGSNTAQAAENTPQSGSGFGLNEAQQAGANANALYSTLAPELETEVAHPAGFSQSDLAAMNTASQQSAGGGQAAAVGQGALLAGRTRNAGTASAAVGEAARSSAQNLSKAALGTQMANSRLKEQQREGGERGLEGLTAEQFGMVPANLGASSSESNATANLINSNTNAANQSWDWAKYILDPAMSGASNYFAHH